MIYAFDTYEIDTGRVELRASGKAVPVEPQVFAILCLLAENRERMVSKDEILEKIWDGRIVSDAALTSRIKSARAVVGDDGSRQGVIRTVRGRGFRFVAELTTRAGVAAEGSGRQSGASDMDVAAGPASPARGRAREPSLAVLRFDWLGSADANRILVEALPQEVITALSRLRWLSVIARGSSFRFASGDDLGVAAQSLNVDYCVTGTVEQRRGDIVASVDLVHARDGRVLWSERFAFELDGIDEVRADVVARIVTSLEIHIPKHEAELARGIAAAQLDAWAEYHLGLQAMFRFNKNDNAAATLHFRRAVELDSGFARAYAGLSFTRFQDGFLKYASDVAEARAGAREYAERAVQLDPHDPFANLTLGRAYFLVGDIDSSLDWLERAVELSPSFAQGFYSWAWAEIMAGRSEDARRHVDEAIRLSPLDPLMYAMLGTRALSHVQMNEMDEAAAWAHRAARTPGAHVFLAHIAAAAHALAGDAARAAQWAANARSRRPDLGRAQFFESFPFADAGVRELLDDALRHQGL